MQNLVVFGTRIIIQVKTNNHDTRVNFKVRTSLISRYNIYVECR